MKLIAEEPPKHLPLDDREQAAMAICKYNSVPGPREFPFSDELLLPLSQR